MKVQTEESKMETYFNIRYEFDKRRVHELIDEQLDKDEPGYVCVADGVIVTHVHRDEHYRTVVNGSMFSVCDSGFVPLYLRWIYGKRYEQYCGAQIFQDIVRAGRHRMFFMGTSHDTLAGLRRTLMTWNPSVADMTFMDLPYRRVEDFDYAAIARAVETDGADIIWVALGAPKQEIFMSLLRPHLRRGVVIAVGAVFKFYSGTDERRAPQWMVRAHLEFVFRILSEPGKQLRRCWGILSALPAVLWQEWRRKQTRLVTQ